MDSPTINRQPTERLWTAQRTMGALDAHRALPATNDDATVETVAEFGIVQRDQPMFRRKKTFDDDKKSELARALSGMLAIQMALAVGSIQDANGRINRKAIGYIYGFIDCALRSIGQDMGDVAVGVPITYQVLRDLFPGHEQAYTNFLIGHLKDEVVVLGMMSGGQQYADFIITPGAKGAPMGLAKFILEGDE